MHGVGATCLVAEAYGLRSWGFSRALWCAFTPRKLSVDECSGPSAQFAVGLWITIDAAVLASQTEGSTPIEFVDWLPTIIGTLALIMYVHCVVGSWID